MRRFSEKIIIKWKAAHLFEEEPKMIIDHKEYMKYGPSDDEE